MGFPLPETLTPSKISAFVSCPLAFRYAYIDHLPEPAADYLVRGTLVHRALQLLYSETATKGRTPERARAAVVEAWTEMETSDEVAGLELNEAASGAFVDNACTLVDRYFTLEDPAEVEPIGLELDLRASLGGLELRGIIDRLDHLPGDEFAVVDYKTGRAPRPDYARSAMTGVYFYALLCELALQRRPREVRLMYLRDQVVLVESPSDQAMRGLRQRAVAVWSAIERACDSGDFRPNPSTRCRFCAFQEHCPSFGGRLYARAATD